MADEVAAAMGTAAATTEAPRAATAPCVVHLWSGPRCCSTSLMYSFAQRNDTQVFDEPLYASYLTTTGQDRPYRSLVLQAQPSDGTVVVGQLLREALSAVPPAPATPTPSNPSTPSTHGARPFNPLAPATPSAKDSIASPLASASASFHNGAAVGQAGVAGVGASTPGTPSSSSGWVAPAAEAAAASTGAGSYRPVVFAKHMAKHKVGVPVTALFRPTAGLTAGLTAGANGSAGAHGVGHGEQQQQQQAIQQRQSSGGCSDAGSMGGAPPGSGSLGPACDVKHLLLVRDPYAVLQSFSKVLAPSQQELGYTALLEIASELRAQGQKVYVVVSDHLVKEPEPMLRAICAALDLPFQREMLRWPTGPKPYDGVWAPWWYANTHRGTGFASSVQDSRRPLPQHLRQLLGECQALYRLLKRDALAPMPASEFEFELDMVGLGVSPPRSLPAPAAVAQQPAQPATAGPLQAHALGQMSSTHAAAVLAAAAGKLPGSLQGTPMKQHPSQQSFAQEQQLQQAPNAHEHKAGTHSYEQDPRNADVLILIRDGTDNSASLVWRPEARVPVLDSGFMLGDGVWEGVRLEKGVLLHVEEHLARLYEGAKALDMHLDLTPQQVQGLVYSTIDANGMGADSGVHIRLMVTRGLKATPYQSPYITIGNPTIVVIPEYKRAAEGPKRQGIRLFTCHVRRGAADVQDPMWNSHSKLNCIAACIQAKQAGADEALMLDPHGFVATCNSVNFFCVVRGEVWAPTTKYQLHGITRATILRLCKEHGIPCRELDFSLTQVYSADEAFVTGTFAGVTPVRSVDGRSIGPSTRGGEPGPLAQRLQELYKEDVERYVSHGRRDFGDAGPTSLHWKA